MLRFGMAWLGIMTLATMLVAPAGAALFEEHVTDGTLDETWIDYSTGSGGFKILSDQYVSPSYSRGTTTVVDDNHTSYGDNLSLPDTYAYQAAVRTDGSRPRLRGGILFNCQSTAGFDVDDYELLLWEGSLLLGKRISGGWNGLGSKAGFFVGDQWYNLEVRVSYQSGNVLIDTYVDGNQITWDGGATTITDSGVGGVDPFRGGTIGIHSNSSARNWYDDMIVTPEPATMLLLGLGGALTLWRRH